MSSSGRSLRPTAVGLLSAGAAALLAACSGPARVVHGPIAGTVRDAEGPLPGARVCVQEESGRCVFADEAGAFSFARFRSESQSLHLCAAVETGGTSALERQTCMPLDPETGGNTIIHLERLRARSRAE